MGEYFNSWRTTIGCVMLLLACIVTGMWLRSLSSWDKVFFPIGNRTHEITSFRGGIIWSSWDHVGLERGFRTDIPFSNDKTFVEFMKVWSNPIFVSWKMRWWSVFYWQIAVPLALLSSYLLLGNPRVAKSGLKESDPR